MCVDAGHRDNSSIHRNGSIHGNGSIHANGINPTSTVLLQQELKPPNVKSKRKNALRGLKFHRKKNNQPAKELPVNQQTSPPSNLLSLDRTWPSSQWPHSQPGSKNSSRNSLLSVGNESRDLTDSELEDILVNPQRSVSWPPSEEVSMSVGWYIVIDE